MKRLTFLIFLILACSSLMPLGSADPEIRVAISDFDSFMIEKYVANAVTELLTTASPDPQNLP